MKNFLLRWAADFRANPTAAFLDFSAAIMSVASSIFLAVTAGNPPMIVIFPVWVASSVMLFITGWLRGNGSMAGQMAVNTVVNSYGLVHLLHV